VKLLAKIVLSLTVGVLCIALALSKIDLHKTKAVLRAMPLSVVLLYGLSMVPLHLFRAWRWKYLLRPIGVSLPFGRLMIISTVGFMAILALPFRLGEFARPYYVVREGTFAHERRAGDRGRGAHRRRTGHRHPAFHNLPLFPRARRSCLSAQVLAISAWLALLGFLGLTAFLGFALRWPDATIGLALKVTFLRRISPKFADKLADKLRALIQGFRALGHARDMLPFLLQTALYWGANGLGMWFLARLMHLPIPIHAAFAAMAFTGVVISLPNAPGLVGQFHAGIVLALAAYLPESILTSVGGAYAIALHGIQFVWYVALGFLALLFVGERAGSLRTMVVESKRVAEQGGE
jgi:uncharacterized membrane protein YbhN (UPF0104 family)